MPASDSRGFSARHRAGGTPALQTKELGEIQAAVCDFVLQCGSKLINVPGGYIYGHAVLQKRCAVTADGVAPDLQQESVDGVGIEFQRRESNDLAQSVAYRKRFAIR